MLGELRMYTKNALITAVRDILTLEALKGFGANFPT